MNLHIRPLAEEDIEPVVQLSLLAWEPVFVSFQQVLGPEIYRLIYPDWRRSQSEGVEGICSDTEHNITWVAEVNDIVVGFVAYQLNSQTKIGEIYMLAVHPQYQNRQIGTELNNFALSKMKESGMELAEVGTGGDSGHAPARRTYEKAGYTALPLVRYFKTL